MLSLPVISLPTIDRVGRYPLVNPSLEFTYRNPTHAIHLYNYSATVRIGGQDYQVESGDITCIESGTVYSIETREYEAEISHWCVHFYDDGRGELQFPSILRLGHDSLFLREQIKHISSLHNAHGLPEAVSVMRVEAQYRLKAFLLGLHHQTQGGKKRTRRKQIYSMDKLLEWMEENLSHTLDMETLSTQAKVSRSTLAKHFRENQGMTVNQYLLHKRIDRAKSLLITTSLSIKEIADSVGIPDQHYFNKQFRKVAGESPSQYREIQQTYLTTQPPEEATQDGAWVQ